jgi:ankyrin repeat protein
MVKVLLEAGVDVNGKDAAESVVLHIAVDAGSESLTLLLIAFKADVDA